MPQLEYEIKAISKPGGQSMALANLEEIKIDTSAGTDERLPSPAELLLTALAGCILKNVERYSKILHLPYRCAQITVRGWRQDRPPAMQKIVYELFIDTDVDDKKLDLWHRNILRFGTITNTLAKAVDLSGTISRISCGSDVPLSINH